ncbi:hypothetical protein Dimus_016728 [Dionaea muscipula]
MVGRRFSSLQRRVREVACDSNSPDPHCRGLTRGSPSPTAPHFRRAPASPGLRKHRRRTPSPMLLSSPDPAELSTSEDGEATVAAVTTSEDEGHADLGGGRLDSALFFKATSFPVEPDMSEGSALEKSSGSSTISPTTAVLLCQNTIDAGGPAEGRLKLVRAGSDCSVSSPSVGVGPVESDEVRLVDVDGDGGQGSDDLGLASVSLNGSSPPDHRASSGCESMMLREGLEFSVAECVDTQNIMKAGEALNSFTDEAAVQCTGCDRVSHDFLPSIDAAMAGGQVILDASPQLVGSNLSGVARTFCDSSFPAIGGSGVHDGDGWVSEEGRVSPVAREILRPQPADGLRQSPSSPVDPVSGTEGDGDSISSCSSAILAPPPWLIQRFEDTGGREVWLEAYPLAHKKASARTRSRRIAKRMSKAAVADGDFREKLGCRRSGRLSSPACPVPEELGSGSFPVLTPIDEVLGSDVLQNEEGDDSVDLVLDLAIVPGDSAILGEDSEISSAVLRAPSPMRGGSEGPRAARDSDVPRDVQPPMLPVTEEMLNVEGAQGGLGELVNGVSALLPAALVSGPCVPSVDADVFVDNSTVVCSSVMGDFVEVEEELAASTEGGQQALVGGDAVRLPSTDGRQQQPPLPPTSCLRVGKDLRCSGDSEERRQQVSPNGGERVVDGGSDLAGGLAKGGAGRSYASTVGADRRSDVRLHFVPEVMSLDDQELCMLDSDRDDVEWDVCLVGHFLQSGVPYSVVRPRLLHLWREAGLVEVRSLDVGFFLMRNLKAEMISQPSLDQ